MPDGSDLRTQVMERFNIGDIRQLMLVKYAESHDPMDEWVFNGADIQTQRIIWARDMGPEKNQELIDYFKGRTVWLVEPDETPVRVRPYSAGIDADVVAGEPSAH